MYNVHGWGVVLCCLGGALGWAVYLAMGMVTGSIYLRYLVAGIAIAAYAEAMARVRKYPITAYLVVSFFPLVPGSYIYYASGSCFWSRGSRPWAWPAAWPSGLFWCPPPCAPVSPGAERGG